jgi:hypothetical protein
MSILLNEPVFEMPPISMARIENIGRGLLSLVQPDALTSAMPLDVLHTVEHVLPSLGIHVTPADPAELQDCEAATDPSGTGPVEILVAEPVWDSLVAGGRKANRARTTVMHEVAHAVLHVPVVRRRNAKPDRDQLLRRVSRSQLAPYRDPEWQAFALAGCTLAPRSTLEPLVMAGHYSDSLAEIYGISSGMMSSHLRRLRLAEGSTW